MFIFLTFNFLRVETRETRKIKHFGETSHYRPPVTIRYTGDTGRLRLGMHVFPPSISSCGVGKHLK